MSWNHSLSAIKSTDHSEASLVNEHRRPFVFFFQFLCYAIIAGPLLLGSIILIMFPMDLLPDYPLVDFIWLALFSYLLLLLTVWTAVYSWRFGRWFRSELDSLWDRYTSQPQSKTEVPFPTLPGFFAFVLAESKPCQGEPDTPALRNIRYQITAGLIIMTLSLIVLGIMVTSGMIDVSVGGGENPIFSSESIRSLMIVAISAVGGPILAFVTLVMLLVANNLQDAVLLLFIFGPASIYAFLGVYNLSFELEKEIYMVIAD